MFSGYAETIAYLCDGYAIGIFGKQLGDHASCCIDVCGGKIEALLFHDQLAADQFTQFGTIHSGRIGRCKPGINKCTYENVVGQRIADLTPHHPALLNTNANIVHEWNH